MLYKFKDKSPELADDTFAAPGAHIIGDVVMKERSSVWYNAVVRGDLAGIKVGKYSNIQDSSTVHVEEKHNVEIGDYVTVGHNAIIHGCKIGDKSLIGMNTTILSGAKIGAGSIIGAGAVVPKNSEIPAGSLVVGVPAKVISELDEKKIEGIKKHAIHYAELASEHNEMQKNNN